MPTQAELAEILIVLAAAYPRFTLTSETIKVYKVLLDDIPIADLRAAATHCAATGDFFPSVHELRQAVVDLRRIAAGIPTAFQAWEDLCSAWPGERSFLDEDSYLVRRRYIWLHPWVEEVGRQLGWPDHFLRSEDQTGMDRAHFFKAWDTYVALRLNEDAMLPDVRKFVEGQRSVLQITDLISGKE